MSTDRDVTRIVRSWLDEGVTMLPDRVLDAVLDRVPATPQRRAVWLARRFPIMNNTMRTAIAAAVVVVAFVGYQVISGPSVGDQSPSPSASTAPSAAQSPAPSELPFGADQPLDPGTYTLGGFPVGITFEVPAGWVSCSSGLTEQGACKDSTDTEPGSSVVFLIVGNVVADPCTTNELAPPVGPSVDDLVTAISNLEGFEATPATDLTVDGFSGKQFTVTAPEDAGCSLSSWTTDNGANGVGPGEINVMRILDVDGVRVVISGAYQTGTSEEQLAAILQVIESVHIEP